VRPETIAIRPSRARRLPRPLATDAPTDEAGRREHDRQPQIAPQLGARESRCAHRRTPGHQRSSSNCAAIARSVTSAPPPSTIERGLGICAVAGDDIPRRCTAISSPRTSSPRCRLALYRPALRRRFPITERNARYLPCQLRFKLVLLTNCNDVYFGSTCAEKGPPGQPSRRFVTRERTPGAPTHLAALNRRATRRPQYPTSTSKLGASRSAVLPEKA